MLGVQYTSWGAWEVEVEFVGDVVHLEVDEIVPRIPLRDFLRHTAPLTAYKVQSSEAANDPE